MAGFTRSKEEEAAFQDRVKNKMKELAKMTAESWQEGLTQQRLGKKEEKTTFARSVKRDPDKAQEEKAEGNKQFAAGDYTAAEKHYSVAIDSDPTDHVHFSNRAACRLEMAKKMDEGNAKTECLREAQGDAGECVRLNPKWQKGWTRKATAEISLRSFADAEQSIVKGLELASADQGLRMMLQGIRDEGHVTSTKTDVAVSHNMLHKPKAMQAKERGNHYFTNKHWAEAVKEYTVALSYDPTDAVFYANRSSCYAAMAKFAGRWAVREKMWKDALRDAEQAVSRRADYAKGHVRKAAALQGLQRWEEAAAAARAGLRLDKENTLLRDVLTAAREKAGEKGADDAADDAEPAAKKPRADGAAAASIPAPPGPVPVSARPPVAPPQG